MELRILRYFIATVDAGTITAAAQASHVTQPAMSRQIKQLENELGVALFERRAGRVLLTAAGHQLVPVVRGLLDEAVRIERMAGVIAGGGLESVVVAAPATTLADVVAPFVATLGSSDPTPNVVESGAGSAHDALVAGADLAIVDERPAAHLGSIVLARLPVWAYVPASHRWAGRQRVDLAELAEATVICPPGHYASRRTLDAAMHLSGCSHDRVIEVAGSTIAQALAAAGRGVAVVSDDARFDLVPVGITYEGYDLRIQLHAAWETSHPAAQAIETLARRLGDYCVLRYGTAVTPHGPA